MAVDTSGCGAPDQEAPLPASVDLEKETVITGVVRADGGPVAGAYVRLLDASGEFAAEVVTSASGSFRFFAAPGNWTLRALSPFRGRGVFVRLGLCLCPAGRLARPAA